jgi:hypothetical protein
MRVHPAEALLDAVGVPGKVVVDDEMSALEVDALSGGVGGDQHQAGRILGEGLLDDAALLSSHAAVDGHHGFGTTEKPLQTCKDVAQRVAVLGEHECEADDVTSSRSEPLGSVHLLDDVRGHRLVELHLGRRQIRSVDVPRRRAPPTFEAVGVEKGKEELEVLVLPCVRSCRQQQEVARAFREQPAQAIAAGLPYVVAFVVGRHAMRLVDHCQVPLASLEAGEDVVIARQVIHAGDHEVALGERIAGLAGLDGIAGQDVEAQGNLLSKLVLPLGDAPPPGSERRLIEAAAP